ncbi:hypothetical protein ACLMJK_007610 [Lecanora helva]
MRTRHQRQLAEEAGAAPSPPQALPTEPRPKRIRNTKTGASDASSKTQPTTQVSSTHVDASGRVSRTTQSTRARAGRRAAQPRSKRQHDITEAADSTAPLDTSADPGPSSQFEEDPGLSAEEDPRRSPEDDDNGEIPTSLSKSAAHPVHAVYGSPLGRKAPLANVGFARYAYTAQPVLGAGSPSTPQLATHPVSATGVIAQPSITTPQPVQQKKGPSETSLLFARAVASPETPISFGTRPPQGIVGEPSGLALVESPETSPEPSESSDSDSDSDSDSSSSTKSVPELPGLKVPKKPPQVPPSPPVRMEMPQIRGLPETHDKPYSLMHTMINSHLPSGASSSRRTHESVALAVETEHVPFHYLLAAKLNPKMSANIKSDPIVRRICNESQLTDDLDVEIRVTDLKRKREEEEAQFLREAHTPRPSYEGNRGWLQRSVKIPGSSMRAHFLKIAADKRHAALLREFGTQPSPEKRRKTVDDGFSSSVYDENGNLMLGKKKEIAKDTVDAWDPPVQTPVTESPYVDDEVPENTEQRPLQGLYAQQERARQEQVPETPRTRGWGLTSFLPSVSSLNPFSSRRAPLADATPSRANAADDVPSPTPPVAGSNLSNIPSTPEQSMQLQRVPQTAPPQNDIDMSPQRELSNSYATDALAKRRQTGKPRKQLLTKAQWKERDRLKKEREELRAYKERLKQEEARIAREKEEWEEHRKQHENKTVPGHKRKRAPSPDVIPLPPGGGFGLHPDYFYFDSSEEEDESEGEQESPTRNRPVKRARISSSSIIPTGDTTAATPYEGAHFSPSNQSAAATNSNVFQTSVAKTPPATTGRFAVPSPSEDSEDDASTGTASPEEARMAAQMRQSIPMVASAGETRTAPPSPTPASAFPPPGKAWQWVDPVEKARQKALQHQPKFGSRLRESSRLSTSTVGSDAGGEAGANVSDNATSQNATFQNTILQDATTRSDSPIHYTESEYDPKRPAVLPQFIQPAQEQHLSTQNTVQRPSDAGKIMSTPTTNQATQHTFQGASSAEQTTSSLPSSQVAQATVQGASSAETATSSPTTSQGGLRPAFAPVPTPQPFAAPTAKDTTAGEQTEFNTPPSKPDPIMTELPHEEESRLDASEWFQNRQSPRVQEQLKKISLENPDKDWELRQAQFDAEFETFMNLRRIEEDREIEEEAGFWPKAYESEPMSDKVRQFIESQFNADALDDDELEAELDSHYQQPEQSSSFEEWKAASQRVQT